MAGYHITEIKKGEYGSLEKIQEELDEAFDAEKQETKIMLLVELADLYGALEGYLEKNIPDFTMDDLKLFSKITKRAFKEGDRT